jgi:hypothetical protein
VTPEANVTLAAGNTTTDTWGVTFAQRVVTDQDPTSATYGAVLTDITVAGYIDPVTGFFVTVDDGAGAGVDPTTYDPTANPGFYLGQEVLPGTGANLTMDGDFTMTGGNVSIVTEDDATTGNSASVTVNPNNINLHVGGESTDLDMGPEDITLSASGEIALNGDTVTVNGENVATEPYVDAAVLVETNNRIADVNAEEAARIADVNAEETARIAADNAEAATRASEDTSIRNEFRAADEELQDNINTERTQRIADVNAEESARIDADANLQRQIDENSDDIKDLEDELDAVASMSAAMSALVPNDRAAGNTQISLGLGTYDGATAGALGLFHYVNDNILLNAGAAADFSGDGEVAGRAGITIGF